MKEREAQAILQVRRKRTKDKKGRGLRERSDGGTRKKRMKKWSKKKRKGTKGRRRM